MKSEILVPKNLRANDSRRLFAMTGFNRESRRNTKLTGEQLVLALLDPAKRLWRFWCVWWPVRAGSGVPHGWSSIDLRALMDFQPDLRSRSCDEEAVAKSLAEFELDPEAIRADIVPAGQADFSFSFRPFAVWQEIKAALPRWPALTNAERDTVVNAVFALDGISSSDRFTSAATQLQPDCAAAFEAVTVFTEEPEKQNGGPMDQSDSAPEANRKSPEETWRSHWRELSEIANTALAGLIASDPVEQAKAKLLALEEVVRSADVERQTGEKALADLAKCLTRADAVLLELSPLARRDDGPLIDTIRRAVAGAPLDQRASFAEAVEQSSRSLNERLDRLEEAEAARPRVTADLNSVETQLSGALALSQRVKLLKEWNELAARKGGLDIALAEQAEQITSSIAELLAQLGVVETKVEIPQSSGTVPTVNAPDRRDSAAESREAKIQDQHQAVQTPIEPTQTGTPAGPQSSTKGHPVTEPSQAPALEPPPSNGRDGGVAEEISSFSDENGERCRPIWDALRSQQPALAYQISLALSEVDPNLMAPPPPLLKAVALAASVQFSHGDVAREIAESFKELDRGFFEGGPAEWREALSILLVAGALRPSLVAPGTGATAVIRYAHPPKYVHELRQIVIEAGERLQGLSLGPSAFREVGGMAGWEQDWKAFQEELADWKKRASRFTLKFGRANDVWRYLISSEGRIGMLLSALEKRAADQSKTVSGIVGELADEQALRRAINHIDRHVIGGRRFQDIQAGALMQLQERSGEALELAQLWSDLVGRMPQEGNFVFRTLETFRQRYRSIRSALDGELSALSTAESRWRLVPTAVTCLKTALASVDDLLAGSGRATERRHDPRRILGLPLLRSPVLNLGVNWIPSQSPGEVLEASVSLARTPVDWRVAFDARLARGDAWGCQEIVTELEDASDPRVEQFRRELNEGIESLRAGLRSRLKDARRDLESALAYGYIEEPERGNLDAELAELEARSEDIGQFEQAQKVIAAAQERLSENKARRLAEVTAEVQELKLKPGSSEEEKMRRVVGAGDVFTAHEYIQRIRAGDSIPEDTNQRVDAFQAFFPERSRAIEGMLESNATAFQQLRAALIEGKSLNGLDFSKVAREQRDTARTMLDGWFALKRAAPGNATTASMLDVITGLGFSGAKLAERNQSGDKVDVGVTAQIISDRNICPIAFFGSQALGRYRAIFVWGKPADEDLPRIVGDSAGGHPSIVFYLGRLGERQRRELARVMRSTGANFLVLDEVLMLHLCTEPGSRLGAFFACALPFSSVKPFVTTSGLVPAEMFFGRTDELKAVTDRSGRCFVYGGRQLGKTALLRASERAFHRPANRQFAAWVDLKAAGIGNAVEVSAIWSTVYKRLIELDKAFFSGLTDPTSGRRQGAVDAFLGDLRRKFAPEGGARLLLLLDEADRFLEQDARSQYHETGRLKNLMESTDRGFKVVFAGLHNVLRTTEQANHPLAHFGDPIEIGPFTGPGEWNEARDMIRGPLLAAGYQLASDDLIVRILAQTNYYPVLIQLYGEQLIRVLHDSNRQRFEVTAGPRYVVNDSLVDEAYRERSLREAIRARFQYTLQLDLRYEVIAYALAWALTERTATFSGGASSKELRDWAVYWWADGFRGVGEQEFRVLLEEMVGLGVLRHVDERTYSLRNPNLLRLLGGNEEIGTVLTKQRETPVEFEPSIFRAPDPSDGSAPARSPLTFTQENSFFADKNGVSLIVGTSAGGLDELKHFLQKRHTELLWRADLTNANEFGKLLDSRREEVRTVLVLPAEVPWGDAWIRQALDKVRRLTSRDRRMRVVFVADPAMLWQLVPSLPDLETLGLEVVPLKPWNEAFFSRWQEDVHIAGNEPGLRQEIVNLTGLWPCALFPLPQRIHQMADLASAIRERMQSKETRVRFLEDLSLPPGEARNALRLLQSLPDEPLENLQAIAPDMGLAADKVHDRMLWAEHLQLAQRSGKDCWRIEPYLDRLLKTTPDA